MKKVGVEKMDNQLAEIVGESRALQRALLHIHKIARSGQSVLIFGETGTGKNLAAKRIHELSGRKDEPFVTINCANIPEELFEAELFGFSRGAYTGADREKKGLLEVAGGGSVFLDEIGELTPRMQAKILQTLECRELRRIGETHPRQINARFLFATNRELEEEVARGRFRKDLYFRINAICLRLPPLRNRKEDIPLLADFFIRRKLMAQDGQCEISSGALNKLKRHDYPGNIRELENIITRASLTKKGTTILAEDIVFDSNSSGYGRQREVSPQRIQEALERCRWNKTLAAKEVGKSRRQFYRLLKKYNLLN